MIKTNFCSFWTESEGDRFKVTVRNNLFVKEFKFKRILSKETISKEDSEFKNQIVVSLIENTPSYKVDYRWVGELEGGSFVWFVPGEHNPNQDTALESIAWLSVGKNIPQDATEHQKIKALFSKESDKSLPDFLVSLQRRVVYKRWLVNIGIPLFLTASIFLLVWAWKTPVEELVSVPYILGENITSAENIIKDKNLQIEVVDRYGNNDLVVFYQEPGEGSLVEPSAIVKIKLKSRLH